MLYAVKDNWKRDPIYNAPLQDAILHMVKGMPQLVALCLAGFPIDESVVEDQLIRDAVPDRHSFWFHLGSELPKASDMSLPRVHYEGIVKPDPPCRAPPHF